MTEVWAVWQALSCATAVFALGAMAGYALCATRHPTAPSTEE